MAFLAALEVEDLAATTGYILVDQSDVTNYPHAVAKPIIVKSVRIDAETETAGAEYNIRIGVLEEVDATDGTTRWFYQSRIASVARLTEHVKFDGGVSCDPAAPGFIGAQVTNNTRFQTDVTIANPTGTNAAPGAGDIVMDIREIAGSGTISAMVTVEYVTQ